MYYRGSLQKKSLKAISVYEDGIRLNGRGFSVISEKYIEAEMIFKMCVRYISWLWLRIFYEELSQTFKPLEGKNCFPFMWKNHLKQMCTSWILCMLHSTQSYVWILYPTFLCPSWIWRQLHSETSEDPEIIALSWEINLSSNKFRIYSFFNLFLTLIINVSFIITFLYQIVRSLEDKTLNDLYRLTYFIPAYICLTQLHVQNTVSSHVDGGFYVSYMLEHVKKITTIILLLETKFMLQ